MPSFALDQLAAALDIAPERLQRMLQEALAFLPQPNYYVLRLNNQGTETQLADKQRRIINAFVSPDDALAFTQRNGYGSNVRLCSVSAADLLKGLLADTSIDELYVQPVNVDADGAASRPVVRLKRSDLLARLQTQHPPALDAQLELTAASYDKLQFGVDFLPRAQFRTALTIAVEQVVASYLPPPGSLDRGPRSIFAVTAVESWLCQNGFPHAHQRRWVSVADEPSWGGAVELCEIDAGTLNHLLVQLLIHADDDGRQYIRRVNVTA